jgi:hypothetical protein
MRQFKMVQQEMSSLVIDSVCCQGDPHASSAVRLLSHRGNIPKLRQPAKGPFALRIAAAADSLEITIAILEHTRTPFGVNEFDLMRQISQLARIGDSAAALVRQFPREFF